MNKLFRLRCYWIASREKIYFSEFPSLVIYCMFNPKFKILQYKWESWFWLSVTSIFKQLVCSWSSFGRKCKIYGNFTLTLILLTWSIEWAPNNDSKWQMGFNWVFKGLILCIFQAVDNELKCINYGIFN